MYSVASRLVPEPGRYGKLAKAEHTKDNSKMMNHRLTRRQALGTAAGFALSPALATFASDTQR